MTAFIAPVILRNQARKTGGKLTLEQSEGQECWSVENPPVTFDSPET